jgi:NADH-quinone oxidoreductase subunit K
MLYFDISIVIFIIFITSIFGVLINKNNIIMIIVCFEIALLAVNMHLLVISIFVDDLLGQLFVLFILVIAAAESSIGLSLLITYYRVTGTVSALFATSLNG